ncbi:hypothetical protein FACS1894195_0610 [Bacteroidia bacterium]|nr:hypothetical protein FACS1894195_0610 [Bacteroidia bacterium]
MKREELREILEEFAEDVVKDVKDSANDGVYFDDQYIEDCVVDLVNNYCENNGSRR